jgi:formylglycine-generating enzyme required for sulfatase activity
MAGGRIVRPLAATFAAGLVCGMVLAAPSRAGDLAALDADLVNLYWLAKYTGVQGHGKTIQGNLAKIRFAELKRAGISRLVSKVAKKKANASRARKRAAAPKAGQVFRDCPDCPEMVVIPAGTFTMGSPTSEEGRLDTEGPQRKVTIARAFAVGKFEVTFEEWDACLAAGGCKYNPDDQGWGRGRRPVIGVSWDDITKEYLPWLSRKTGKIYRLLSEAEWEYAARGVTSASTPSTRYWWGDQASREYMNYGKDRCCGGQKEGRDQWEHTAPVGQFPANPFGLHDMHGNVSEWVKDCWHGSYQGAPSDGSAWDTPDKDCARGVRGGSWYGDPQHLRSAFRLLQYRDIRYIDFGFRLARTL